MKDIFRSSANEDMDLANSLLEQEMNVSNQQVYANGAKEMHDIFMSFVNAGFDEEQAMILLLKQMEIAAYTINGGK